MNEHEATRIAAAMNHARPDWPLKQLHTLLRDERIASRPRRDVFVALAWVASEPNSASPYRVLEAGPWWRAAGIEGSSHGKRGPICVHCGFERQDCVQRWTGDHEFEEPNAWMRRRLEKPIDAHATVTALKQLAHDDRPEPTPEPEHQPNEHVEQLRHIKAAATTEETES